ncbi:cysteine desulfurase family protein, partial [Maribacter dokdonensis]
MISKPKSPEYLDSASTTKVDDKVLKSMIPFFTENYGNASSNHDFGKLAKNAIEKARTKVGELINCDEKEIIFTSGSTESINLAIKGYTESNTEKGNHIITVKTEHKAVLSTCEYLETKGYEVTYLDVDENGLISLSELRDAVYENTLLIAIMYVNNETGVIQPINEIGKIARESGVTFFCDATQAVGKIKVDVEEDSIDMLCFSGHKLNGPKGIGVLYKRGDIEITPLIHGGGQEGGLRGGTYNTPLIVGLGKACELINNEFESNFSKLIEKRLEIEKYYESNNIGIINFKS